MRHFCGHAFPRQHFAGGVSVLLFCKRSAGDVLFFDCEFRTFKDIWVLLRMKGRFSLSVCRFQSFKDFWAVETTEEVSKRVSRPSPIFLRGEKEELLTYLLTYLLPPSVKSPGKLRNFETHFCGHAFPAVAFCWRCCRPVLLQRTGRFSLSVCRFRSFKDFWGFPPAEEVSK